MKDEEFHKYCQETKVPLFIWVVLVLMLLFTVSLATSECGNVIFQ